MKSPLALALALVASACGAPPSPTDLASSGGALRARGDGARLRGPALAARPLSSDARPALPVARAPEVPAAPAEEPAAEEPAALRVGTWNLKRLGHGEKRLDLAARVIEANFDAIALQEVMTTAGVEALLAHLPGWSATVAERAVGENGYLELQAMLTRDSAARVTSARVVEDPADAWVREPMVTCLVARRTDLCVVSIHVVFGDRVGPRDAEIRALAALVGELRDGAGGERDFLVVGDFNRSGSADSFEAFAPGGFHFADDGLTRTTISPTHGWRNPYDHVLLDSVATAEWTGDAARVEFVESECEGDFARCASTISDHGPLVITLDVGGQDDD